MRHREPYRLYYIRLSIWILLIIIFFYISYLWIFFVMVTFSSAHAVFSFDWNRMSQLWAADGTQHIRLFLSRIYFILHSYSWLTRVWLRFSLTFPTLIHAVLSITDRMHQCYVCRSTHYFPTVFMYIVYYYYYYYYYYLTIQSHSLLVF